MSVKNKKGSMQPNFLFVFNGRTKQNSEEETRSSGICKNVKETSLDHERILEVRQMLINELKEFGC